jgi:hypothetical protein
MTDFIETALRHRCRNPRCRSKLPVPVSNSREAFCTKGCHGSFYLRRCLVCEKPIERKRESQKVCRKAKCRSAWRAGSGFGGYVAPSAVNLGAKDAGFVGVKEPIKPDRPWRIVAGSLNPSAFLRATVGAEAAVEAINRTNARHWRDHNAEAEVHCLIQSHGLAVVRLNTPGKERSQFMSGVQPETSPTPAAVFDLIDSIPEDLSIPDFLKVSR